MFFCCDTKNLDASEILINDLLSMDAGMDCVVLSIENPNMGIDHDLLRSELQGTNLLVLWVTFELLQSISAGNWPVEYIAAKEINMPILPISTDDRLFPLFTEKAGAIHGISMSDNEYRTKLKAQLQSFLASDQLIKQIQEKAFTAEMFLSYRKMDINEARRFMNAFHNVKGFETISIWYDNFLTAGRNFNYEIEESIIESDAFVLLVTPRACLVISKMTNGEMFFRQTRQIFAGIICLFQENSTQYGGKTAVSGRFDDYQTRSNLTTVGNYVQTTEYPFAYNAGKIIVPVEAIPSDAERFSALYPGASIAVNINEPLAMKDVFMKKLGRSVIDPAPTNERLFYLGQAYLKGLGVERDITRALEIFERCINVENRFGYLAAWNLELAYFYGRGVPIDYEKAYYWGKVRVTVAEKLFGTSGKESSATASAYKA